MALMVRVVSRRNRTAIASLSGSSFGRRANSCSFHPSRRCSSATKRSALACAVSRHNSPAWRRPKLPSIRFNCSLRNASLPRHQPSPQHLQRLRVNFLQPPPLHVALELLAGQGRVLLDAVFARSRSTRNHAAAAPAPPSTKQNCSTGRPATDPLPHTLGSELLATRSNPPGLEAMMHGNTLSPRRRSTPDYGLPSSRITLRHRSRILPPCQVLTSQTSSTGSMLVAEPHESGRSLGLQSPVGSR
jgi:hypothetical protein